MPNVQQSGSGPKPHQILYGHDTEVTCVAIMTELDVAVSGSKVYSGEFGPSSPKRPKNLKNVPAARWRYL